MLHHAGGAIQICAIENLNLPVEVLPQAMLTSWIASDHRLMANHQEVPNVSHAIVAQALFYLLLAGSRVLLSLLDWAISAISKYWPTCVARSRILSVMASWVLSPES